MFRNLSTILCVIAIFFIARKGLNKDPTIVIRKYGKDVLGYFGNLNMKQHNKNTQKARISNENTFAKKKIYKTITTMLFDLGWIEVTVEGFIFTMTIFSLLVNLVFLLYTRSMFLFIVGVPATMTFLFVLAYMSSNSGHYAKEFALLAAEDLIITSIHDGILKAVKSNISLFSDEVKPYFERFISDKEDFKKPTEAALDDLTVKLGESFFPFSEKIKEFERTGKKGTLDTFKDDLNLNVMKRTDMMELEDTLQKCNSSYLTMLAIVGVLTVVVFCSSKEITKIAFTTGIGRAVIVIILILILRGFAFLQALRN